MILLTLRTDNPEAEIGVYDNAKQLSYVAWQAHRQLAETIHQRIDEQCLVSGQSTETLEGIVVYKGPGSFTGLRIGVTVANAFAAALGIPIVSTTGEDWIGQGIARLVEGQDEISVQPEYGSEPHITQPKK